MQLTPEHQLDPRSEASMTLITLTNELRRLNRIADYARESYTQASARREAKKIQAQITVHKAQHGIA